MMSFPQKRSWTPTDAATLELWRAAEDGDINELATVLSRVPDINARNEHGVTALMRAAQYGHLKAVRILLDHGADANITRNDKFTALALAAFFGHTEIVRTLMEHGADSKASTRHGTSPHMWATARTFNKVVDQLQNPAPPKTTERLAPVKAKDQVARTLAPPPVVRTLKDPPEIWDLVHEVPRGFDARSAFISRLTSIQKGFAFRAATVALLVGGLAVGALVLRRVQARSERDIKIRPVSLSIEEKPNSSQAPNSSQGVDSSQAPNSSEAIAPVTPPSTEVNSSAEEINTSQVGRRSSSRSTFSSHRVTREVTPRVVASEEVQPVVAVPEKPKTTVRAQSANETKVSAPLSPQLITPAKSAAPKAKVIQWP